VSSTDCIPDYKIAGGICSKCTTSKCNLKNNCHFRNYGIDGGTCLQGSSDIFAHCTGTAERGEWGKWEENRYCADTDYFKQKYRKCKNTGRTDGAVVCDGHWLEVRYFTPKKFTFFRPIFFTPIFLLFLHQCFLHQYLAHSMRSMHQKQHRGRKLQL